MAYPQVLRAALTALLACALAVCAYATHNRAGEIRVRQIGNGLEVEAIVVTYTAFQGDSNDADRDSVTVVWGDGTTSLVGRENGPVVGGTPNGEPLGDNIKVNIYRARHRYSGRGQYVVGMADPNRVAGIRNINNGGSVEIQFYIRTVFTFLDPNFQGPNSTPILLQAPIDDACTGSVFTHNPNAFDPDGDSLAYELGVPLQGEDIPVVNYQLPNEFTGPDGGQSRFRLDPVTGTLTWDAPQQQGDYNVVINVISYRGGFPIDTTVRDMQITVRECDNRPPQIEVDNEFCLVAGQSIALDPVATAPLADSTQRVRLEATSATFDLPFSPATWTGDSLYHDQPWTARYAWTTVCEHPNRFPYNVIFKATDDFRSAAQNNRDNSDLAALEVVSILVSAPPPEEVAASAEDGLVDVTWAAPYACEEAADSFFIGFSVWRREGSNPFPFDSCVQGLAGRGYTRVATQVRERSDGRYRYVDDDVERGRTFCYRVVAQFARRTSSGRVFNIVESIASEEACVQSSRDIPLLTRADVLETGVADGVVDVRWTPPLPDDLDTLANPPPYTYELLRSPGIGTSDFAPVPGTRATYDSYAALLSDTMYVDEGRNTEAQGFTYAVDFRVGGDGEALTPVPSSTVLLGAASSDRVNVLTWEAETSWENFEYDVLRENDAGGFDTIATTGTPTYRDEGLVNGIEYCYRVIAYGTYGVNTIYTPLVNRSQRLCATPLDTIGPCPPNIGVFSICDELTDENARPPYTTRLRYRFENAGCGASDDIDVLRVYELSDSVGTARSLLGEIRYPDADDFEIVNEFEVAGCYGVTAVDTLGNEGELSTIRCIPNCPFYELPNVITPNGDDVHEVLRPRVNRFVAAVDFQLFDRWGVKVYETEDPELGWDATTLSGEPVSDGTYYYTCRVFEPDTDGVPILVEEGGELSGYIEVFRGANQ